jgi:hypothetical protein
MDSAFRDDQKQNARKRKRRQPLLPLRALAAIPHVRNNTGDEYAAGGTE